MKSAIATACDLPCSWQLTLGYLCRKSALPHGQGYIVIRVRLDNELALHRLSTCAVWQQVSAPRGLHTTTSVGSRGFRGGMICQ